MRINRDRIKISFDEAKFFVNEAKGNVTCVLNYEVVVPEVSVESHWPFLDHQTLHSFCGTSKGTAKCSPNDTFNLKTGKEVSSAKAEKAAYFYALKKLRKQWEVAEFFKDVLDDFTLKAEGVIDHNDNYIERITQ